MAGTNAAFDPDVFREAIRGAMAMGAPTNTADQATFRWDADKTFTTEDPAHRPYTWTSTPATSATHPDVVLEHVAVEFSSRPAGSLDTHLGQFDTSRAVLTLLDEEYELVATADVVLLGQNTYMIDFWGPPMGLFEVTVYQAFCSAQDES